MLKAMSAKHRNGSTSIKPSAGDHQASLFRRMPAEAKLRLVGQYIRFAKVLQNANTVTQTSNGPHAATRNPG